MVTTCTEGEIEISEFGSVRSKTSRIISLRQYVNNVRSDMFKARVEEYMRLAALPGQEAEQAHPVFPDAEICVDLYAFPQGRKL